MAKNYYCCYSIVVYGIYISRIFSCYCVFIHLQGFMKLSSLSIDSSVSDEHQCIPVMFLKIENCLDPVYMSTLG